MCGVRVYLIFLSAFFVFFTFYSLYAVGRFYPCNLVFVQHFDIHVTVCIIDSYEVSAGREEVNIYLNLFV